MDKDAYEYRLLQCDSQETQIKNDLSLSYNERLHKLNNIADERMVAQKNYYRLNAKRLNREYKGEQKKAWAEWYEQDKKEQERKERVGRIIQWIWVGVLGILICGIIMCMGMGIMISYDCLK